MRWWVLLLLLASSAFADEDPKKKLEKAKGGAPEPGAPLAPKREPQSQWLTPPKEIVEQTHYFDGKWTCEGTQFESPIGQEHTTKRQLAFGKTKHGFWHKMTLEKEGGESFWTWDLSKKQLVRADFGNGPSWSTLTSPGWKDDKLIFTGDYMAVGQKFSIRHTVSKQGDAQFGNLYELMDREGKATKWIEEVCKRSSRT